MSSPSSFRVVKLVDARSDGCPLIEARLYRDYPSGQLDEIQTNWAKAREQAAAAGLALGLSPLEHEDWDWRNKADSVETGYHMLIGVECAEHVQGIMALLRLPQPARLESGHVVYIDYLESAPWNLKLYAQIPRFFGVGTILVAEAVRLSLEMGLGGRIGLHSLPQAEAFYKARCGMTKLGKDRDYFGLTYFEFNGQQSVEWLAKIGGNL